MSRELEAQLFTRLSVNGESSEIVKAASRRFDFDFRTAIIVGS